MLVVRFTPEAITNDAIKWPWFYPSTDHKIVVPGPEVPSVPSHLKSFNLQAFVTLVTQRLAMAVHSLFDVVMTQCKGPCVETIH